LTQDRRKDGRLELDNNRSERSIKPFVIGRKNWLFANTPRGAKASAAIYSVIDGKRERVESVSVSEVPVRAASATCGSERSRGAGSIAALVVVIACDLPDIPTINFSEALISVEQVGAI
jgi:hypothetical protein